MSVHAPTQDLLPRIQRSASSALAPLQREMNRVFEQLGDGWNAFSEFRLAPPMDLIESKDGLELRVELPGLSAKDVKITVDDDSLTVSGERGSEIERGDRNLKIIERASGAFTRTIYLPASVDRDRIAAELKDGLLTIVAPKRPDAEARSIEIKTA